MLTGFHNAHELAASLRTAVKEFPGAPACFAGFPILMELRRAPLMTLRYVVETAQSWMTEAPRETGGRADGISKKAVLVDCLGNVEYRFDVSKKLFDELELNLCVLKCSCRVVELLLAFEAVRYLTKKWWSKVRTVLGRAQKA